MTQMLDARHYPAGDAAMECRPGDFILTYSESTPARLIRLGQSLRASAHDWPLTQVNHAAMLVSPGGDLIEALGEGVVRSHLEGYTDRSYYLVRMDAGDSDREHAVRVMESLVGARYNWLGIVSIATRMLFGVRLAVSLDNRYFCSEAVAEGLKALGSVFPIKTVHISPFDLACMVTRGEL